MEVYDHNKSITQGIHEHISWTSDVWLYDEKVLKN